MQPNYSSYSYKELEDCLDRIDKEKYPKRARIIMKLLNDSENIAELKRRDEIKNSYKSEKDKFIHIAFEAILFLLSLVALVAIGYF